MCYHSQKLKLHPVTSSYIFLGATKAYYTQFLMLNTMQQSLTQEYVAEASKQTFCPICVNIAKKINLHPVTSSYIFLGATKAYYTPFLMLNTMHQSFTQEYVAEASKQRFCPICVNIAKSSTCTRLHPVTYS